MTAFPSEAAAGGGMKAHTYKVTVQWTGSRGPGTRSYTSYDRSHLVRAGAKPPIPGSSDPAFRGDAERWSPEELLVASLSACHKLWYLHLCASAGVTVLKYEDTATGSMIENPDGSGQFASVTLRPVVTVSADSDTGKAMELHREASRMCFIARSVNFPVEHEPKVNVV